MLSVICCSLCFDTYIDLPLQYHREPFLHLTFPWCFPFVVNYYPLPQPEDHWIVSHMIWFYNICLLESISSHLTKCTDDSFILLFESIDYSILLLGKIPLYGCTSLFGYSSVKIILIILRFWQLSINLLKFHIQVHWTF